MRIKHIRFGRRRAGVPRDAFQEAWIRHHAPMMAKKTQAERYYQVSFSTVARESDTPFHHAVVLWYRDYDHWQRAYAAPPPLEGDPTVPLSDRRGGLLLVTTEHVLVDGPETLATSSWYLRPAPPDAFIGGELPLAWQREAEVLMRDVQSPPVRFVTSIVNDPAPDATYVALTEVGWPTETVRTSGEQSRVVRELLSGSTLLHPAQPVTVIRGPAQ